VTGSLSGFAFGVAYNVIAKHLRLRLHGRFD
jgi:hypothetical protein